MAKKKPKKKEKRFCITDKHAIMETMDYFDPPDEHDMLVDQSDCPDFDDEEVMEDKGGD